LGLGRAYIDKAVVLGRAVDLAVSRTVSWNSAWHTLTRWLFG
jgi:hypothetical protein